MLYEGNGRIDQRHLRSSALTWCSGSSVQPPSCSNKIWCSVIANGMRARPPHPPALTPRNHPPARAPRYRAPGRRALQAACTGGDRVPDPPSSWSPMIGADGDRHVRWPGRPRPTCSPAPRVGDGPDRRQLPPAALLRPNGRGGTNAEVLAAGARAAVLLGVGGYAFIEGARPAVRTARRHRRRAARARHRRPARDLVSMLVLNSGRGANHELRTAFLEVVNDALGSVAVIISAVVIAWTGWTRIDAVAGMLIAALIVPRAITILQEAGNILLESTPPGLVWTGFAGTSTEVPHVVRCTTCTLPPSPPDCPSSPPTSSSKTPASPTGATQMLAGTSRPVWPTTSTSASNTPPSNSNPHPQRFRARHA